MAVTKVLVVEDVEEISDVVVAVLTAAAYEVEVAAEGPAGLARAIEWLPDVVILDLSLPGMDGTEVCRGLRAAGVDSYVLMLSARHEEVDKVVGLSVGADDYITKPFSPRELAARVQAMMRRPRVSPPKTGSEGVIRLGPVTIDAGAREVAVRGALVALTKTEYDILALLADQPKRVVTRDRLRAAVWGEDWRSDDHAVDVHVSNLRAKLTKAGAESFVRTVRGVGYRISPDIS